MKQKTLTAEDLVHIAKHFNASKRMIQKDLTPEQEAARKALHEELNSHFDTFTPEDKP